MIGRDNLKRFTHNFDVLTEAEKRVCNYIVGNPKEISNLNINELARKSHTSKTVVINMSQKLDFEGFADLKFYLKNKFKNTEEEISSQETTNQIVRLASMTSEIINYVKIEEVAEEILKAKTVYIAGRGTSKACASHLNHLLLTIGVKCLLIEDYNLLTLVAEKMDSDEMLVLISLSGNTRRIVEAAKFAKIRNASLASITSFTNNELSKLADVNLYSASKSIDTAEDDDISRVGLFIIAEILAHQVKIHLK